MPKIPDRWLDYKPIGEPIKGTRFVAFKVPLSQAVNENVKDIDNRLDISKLLTEIPNLGLVIDLTFTTKYYDPQSFKDEGIEHVKLMIPGKKVPNRQHINLFTKYVQDFVNNDNNTDKLIGVHCTHGVNRTGFLICHHMVKCLKVLPEDALKDFESARGHKIERENYRDTINNLLPNIDQNDGLDIPKSSGTNRCLKRSLDPMSYASKSIRREGQTIASRHSNNNGNDVPYRRRKGQSRFNPPEEQSKAIEPWRNQGPTNSGHNYRSHNSNQNPNNKFNRFNPPEQQSKSWRNQGPTNSGHNYRSHNSNQNPNNKFNRFNPPEQQSKITESWRNQGSTNSRYNYRSHNNNRNSNDSRDFNNSQNNNARLDPFPSNSIFYS